MLAWGDVVAYRVDKADLPSVIDRAAAVRDLKQVSTKAPQVIKVAPDDSQHRNESMVQIQLSNVSGRVSGPVQYRRRRHDPDALSDRLGSRRRSRTPISSFPVRVREPFGADQIVAITSETRMTQLEQALLQLNRRRAAGQMMKMVQRYAPPDARIGSAGLFTAP